MPYKDLEKRREASRLWFANRIEHLGRKSSNGREGQGLDPPPTQPSDTKGTMPL